MSQSLREFRGSVGAQGALLYMAGVPDAALGDRVVVNTGRGAARSGQVILSSAELVIVQVFEGVDDLALEDTWVRFLERPFELNLTPSILGRVFDGLGKPRDGRPPIVGGVRRNVNGAPVNPAARAYPRDFLQTGISTIDGLNALVLGQKLPIFSGAGLPHHQLAAQIVRQARLPGGTANFALVFAAMGVSYEEARFFEESFAQSGVLSRVVMFVNRADDPPMERLILPRSALTAAEYLAFELDQQVLVVMTDMNHYAASLREIATAKGDAPARKGYPGYLYSDLAELYERAGRIQDKPGSVTFIPVLSMPSDDITHPLPDLTGYITEGQIVLDRTLHNQGIYPPIAILPSLSRLMKEGVGKDYTREDHPRWASQIFAAYAKALEIRNLAAIIGADELSRRDRQFLEFALTFEQRFVGQGDSERSWQQTLELGWELLAHLPKDVLTRVSEADLAQYYPTHPGGTDNHATAS
jgi:V/A-type H+-transporting ATPase subunit B